MLITASHRLCVRSRGRTRTAWKKRSAVASPSTWGLRTPCCLPVRELSFIDVPGHVKFLRNMLAGVGGVSACVFVVAATEGWKPQSEEHLRILELLGIRHGITALTKVDLVDDEWLELAQMEVADHVEGTFLEGAPMVPVSSTSGTGLDAMRSELDALIERSTAAVDRKRPRLWLDRVFAAKGSGTVGTGTLVGGTVAE